MSGVAGGLGIISQAFGAMTDLALTSQNYRNAMSMMEYQNEWNSPKSQLKRAYDAGLNPNAVNQTIAGSPGFGSMAQADAASLPDSVPTNLGSMIGNSVNNALNAELIKSNIKNTDADTRGKENENKYNESTMDARIQQALDSGAITSVEAEKARLYLEKYPELLDMSVEELRSNIDKTYAETDRINKEIDKIDQDIKESDKRIEKLEQDIRTAKSQEAKNYAEIALTKEKTTNQQLLNNKQEMENNREALTGSATGTVAAYMDIANREGKDAADKWLDENNAIANKVIQNSSEASAQGAQNVVNNTPQGQLKKMYQDQMNAALKECDDNIAKLRQQLHNAYTTARKNEIKSGIRAEEKKKRSIEREFRGKMRRVDKGVSGGISVLGTGANIGG